MRRNNSRKTKAILAGAVGAAGLFVIGQRAEAANYTYIGTGHWQTATNWSSSTLPTSADTTAVFIDRGTAGSANVYIQQNWTFNSLTFAATNALQFNPLRGGTGVFSITLAGTNPFVEQDCAVNQEFLSNGTSGMSLNLSVNTQFRGTGSGIVQASVITGSGNLEKLGSSTFKVNDLTGYSGGITVTEGMLDLSGSTLNMGRAVNLNGGTIKVATSTLSASSTAPPMTLNAVAGKISTIETVSSLIINNNSGTLGAHTGSLFVGSGIIVKKGSGSYINVHSALTGTRFQFTGTLDVSEGYCNNTLANTWSKCNLSVRDNGYVQGAPDAYGGILSGYSATQSGTTTSCFITGGTITVAGTVSPGGFNIDNSVKNDTAMLRFVGTSSTNASNKLVLNSGATYRANINGAGDSDVLRVDYGGTAVGGGLLQITAGAKMDVVLARPKTDIAGGTWNVAITNTGISGSFATTYLTQAAGSATANGSGWSGLGTTSGYQSALGYYAVQVAGNYTAATGAVTASPADAAVIAGGSTTVNINLTNTAATGTINAASLDTAILTGTGAGGTFSSPATASGLMPGSSIATGLTFTAGGAAGTKALAINLTAATAADASSPGFNVDVLDHSNASLAAGSDLDSGLVLSLSGADDTGDAIGSFNIYNREGTAGYTARMNLGSVTVTAVSGDTSILGIDTSGLSGLLAANSSAGVTGILRTGLATPGDYSAVYRLTFADETLPGAGSNSVDVTLAGSVTAVPEPGAVGLLGLGVMAAVGRRRRRW